MEGIRKFLKRLSPFDIFLIVAVFVLAVLAGIKFLSSRGIFVKGSANIELTFVSNQVPAEIAAKVKRGESLLVNNNFFGEIESVIIEPEKIETTDMEGSLHLQDSKTLKKVTIRVKTDAVEGTNGYQKGNARINIGETYNLLAGMVKLQAKITDIKKIK